MADMKVYDSSEISLVLGLISISEGLAEDAFVTIAFAENAFVTKVGADGTVTRSKTRNKSATITITLDQASAHNAELSAVYNLDVNAPNGAGVMPILIKDRQGTSLYIGAKAWISKHPDVTFGKNSTDRVWEISVASLEAITGGN